MAAAFVGGAFLGAVFGELLRAVSEATEKTKMFGDLLKQLERTLKSTAPIIEKIVELNKVLDLPRQETEELIKKMAQGTELVRKCSTVKWNCIQRYRYAKKLLKLDNAILRYFRVENELIGTRDRRMMMLDLREVHLMVKRLSANENSDKMFNLVGIDGPCSVPDPPEITPGFEVPMEELKKDLLKEGVQVIVVSAPGGYGKSTLVKKLCRDDKVQGKFKDNIFFVTFSKTPNVKVIIQKIFQHKKKTVPEFQTDEEAINDLERLLKQIGQEAILLVLDDVWSGSELLLQKFKFQLPDYKILVTSRSSFPQFGSGYNLEPLSNKAAKALFLYSANIQDGNSSFPDENLVNKILRVCKGCPLALTVMGGSLRGQPAAIWRRRVKEWDQGVFTLYSNIAIHDCLKSSLDALNNEVKECYMDLCSFPEDQRIPIPALVDMWSVLYEPDEDGIFVITNLYELSNQNLVNLVVTRENASDNDCYNDHFVMQHDLLRELSIHQSKLGPIEQRKRVVIDISQNNFPKEWLEQKQHPTNAHLLSISTDEMFSSNWYSMQAPKVEVVVLNIRSKKYTLPSFMEQMEELKVLIITNYGFFPTELINFPLLSSLSHLRRIRLEHVSIPSFGMTMVQMKNLQKLSLVMCNVGQALQDPTFQISDAFPNLLEIDIDCCCDLIELPSGLCDIVSIKKLSITNCPYLSTLPEAIGKLVNLEMLTLAACTDLSALPDSILKLSSLFYLDISECLRIKELPQQIGRLCSLTTLCIGDCSICDLPTSIENLKNLEVVKCDAETAHLWKSSPFRPTNADIEVVQEDANLNWLHSP